MNAQAVGRYLGRLSIAIVVALGMAAIVSPAAAAPKEEAPAAVVATFKARFPSAKVEHWTKARRIGRAVYEVDFTDGGIAGEADIAADGTLQNFAKAVDTRTLAKSVTAEVEKKYHGGRIMQVMEITEIKDKKEVSGGYEVTLETQNKHHRELLVSKDGKILEDDEFHPDKD